MGSKTLPMCYNHLSIHIHNEPYFVFNFITSNASMTKLLHEECHHECHCHFIVSMTCVPLQAVYLTNKHF